MGIDRTGLLAGYIEETRGNLDAFEEGVVRLGPDGKDRELTDALLRQLHTLKGTARMMGFPKIERLAHGLEDVLKEVQSQRLAMSPPVRSLLVSAAGVIRRYVDEVERSGEVTSRDTDLVLDSIRRAASGEDFSADFTAFDSSSGSAVPQGGDAGGVQSIRISLSSIDEILRSYDSLVTRQFRLKNHLSEAERLFAGVSARDDIPQAFCRLHEDIGMLERQVFSVQEQLVALRMLPLDIAFRPLRRSIAGEALALGKSVTADIPAVDISLDKAVLETLPEILVHLVRNALDHGIEPPEVRVSAGKDEAGLVSVHARQSSGRILITVSDDGAGIDHEKIRRKAQELYPPRSEEIAAMDRRALMQFLFAPGFTTRSSAGEFSGRGVGLDVVRTEMDRIKGRIRVESQMGKGTTVELSLPLSLATQDGLFVVSGGAKYMVLSHYVGRILNADEQQLMVMPDGTFLAADGELVPVFDPAIILGGRKAHGARRGSGPVVVVEYLERRIALAVERILSYSTVVVKPLPPLFQDFKAVQGIVFDEDYAMVPVLHVPDLMHRLRVLRDYDIKSFEVRSKPREYSVLVVDDSHTTRQIERIILEAEGYRVSTAGDGIEALEQLQRGEFDLVITDIRMPRMDGFVLVDNMRRSEEFSGIPVIVITSVFEPETLRQVTEAGVQGYIVKSDFERGNLVSKVKELLDGQRP